MKRKKGYIILLILCTIASFSAKGQSVAVKASIDSSAIRIGEQRHIKLEVLQPQNAVVHFPVINQTDTLVPGVEILAISKMDTTVENGTKLRITQDILVTSFDTGKYTIPPFKFITKVKELETEKLFLNVATIEADFEHAQVTDIAENYAPGVNWQRILLYLSILVILAALGYIGYILYKAFKRKEEEVVEEVKDNRLPHEVALEELDHIKEEKVWKQGFTKQYYTNITDTLRTYFVKRFKISAMEMTSAEILDMLRHNNDAAPILDNMKQIFYTSDMVKFAKQEPSQEENELSILNAYKIVNDTAQAPEPESQADGEKQEESNEKTEQP